jgi:hypothetical protein
MRAGRSARPPPGKPPPGKILLAAVLDTSPGKPRRIKALLNAGKAFELKRVRASPGRQAVVNSFHVPADPSVSILVVQAPVPAHALAEHKLRKALKMRSKRSVSKFDSEEMELHTNGYVEFVLEALEQTKLRCSAPVILTGEIIFYR